MNFKIDFIRLSNPFMITDFELTGKNTFNIFQCFIGIIITSLYHHKENAIVMVVVLFRLGIANSSS